jgi:serine/threonine protein kinase
VVKPPSDDASADTPFAAPERTLALGPGSAASQPPPPLDAADDPFVGRILGGRYALERVLGRGGMGVVYEARHVSLQRRVAVKVLRSDLSRDPEALQRFEREALAAAAIGNPHIVDVLDFGYGTDGEAYLVMECLDGEALSARLQRQGPLPEAAALRIARQVAEALGAAHRKGIVHRDLKSDNVLLVTRDGEDFVKVVDFGISKVHEDAEGRAPITRDGVILGTPRYMAPEQCTDGAAADHRVDLYALGCILFEMLTGAVPFTGRTAVEVMFKQVHAEAPSLASAGVDAQPAVAAAVARLLAKDPDARFPDAETLLAALPDPDGPSPASVPPSSLATPAPRASEVARWRSRVIAAALVAAGALVTEAVWRTKPPPVAAPGTLSPRPMSSAPPVSPRPAPLPAPTPPPASPAVQPAVAAPPPSEVPPATPVARRCALSLTVVPAVAQLAVGDTPCGRGRCVVERPCGERVTLSAEAPGYRAQRATHALATPRDRLGWRLVPEAPAAVASPVVDAGVPRSAPSPTVGPDGLRLSPYRLP